MYIPNRVPNEEVDLKLEQQAQIDENPHEQFANCPELAMQDPRVKLMPIFLKDLGVGVTTYPKLPSLELQKEETLAYIQKQYADLTMMEREEMNKKAAEKEAKK